jgi:hypothetical protein
MKRDANKKQEQNIQTENKPVIRVQTGLRAGAITALRSCSGDI